MIPVPAGRVLDFGGGMGGTVAALKRRGHATYAAVADQVANSAQGVDRRFVGNLEDEAFRQRMLAAEAPFDTILCLDVLEHLRDPWSVLGQLVDGLRNEGTLVVSVPNVNYIGIVGPLLMRGSWELADSGPLDRTHLRWFTAESLRDMLQAAGLEVVMFKGTTAGKSALLNRLSLGLWERFFAVQYIAVGRKPA